MRKSRQTGGKSSLGSAEVLTALLGAYKLIDDGDGPSAAGNIPEDSDFGTPEES